MGLLGISLWIASQSMPNQASQFNHNFWGRKFLVASFTHLRLALGDHVFPQGLVGKDGWLEYTGDRNLDGYQNAISTSPEELERLQLKLSNFHKQLQGRNIRLILIIPPNKATIYPDKLPSQLQKLDDQSKLDLFTTYVQQRDPSILVDLRPALREGRKVQDVYYKTDTHWNAYGAFIAYTEVMKEAAKTHPRLLPKRIERFKIISMPPHLHDIPQLIGASNLLESSPVFQSRKGIPTLKWITYNDEGIVPIRAAVSSTKNLPRLVMYIDSFGLGLENFIAPHFSETIFIKINSSYQSALTFESLDLLKPDVVIVEMLERTFNIKGLETFLDHFLSGQK